MNTKEPTITVCMSDYQRITKLIENQASAYIEALDTELDRAELVPDQHLPNNVVAMNSIVSFEDLESGAQTTVQLVFPEDANVAQLKISILSPVGSALIGLHTGACIDWPVPQGKVRHLKVVEVKQSGQEINSPTVKKTHSTSAPLSFSPAD